MHAQNVSTFAFNEIPASDPDLVAPHRGTEEWMVMNQVNIPVEGVYTHPLDAYYRFEWTQIEKAKGVYDWTVVDAAFKRAIDKGQKFSFGIMSLCMTCTGELTGNAKSTYPVYLHNEMQAEANKDWVFDGYWIPNWNSNNYLVAWENMLKVVSVHINSTSINGIRLSSIVNYIDIRGYGNWGEWHGYPYGNNEMAANKPTAANLIRIINAHKNAFPDIRLVSLSDAFDTGNWSDVPAEAGYYLLTASNNAGQFGWRRDNWGDPASWYRDKLENNNTAYNGQVFKDLIMNKWKSAPIVGEPSSCCTINGGSCQYWELEAQVRRYHTLSFGNGNLEAPSSTCVRTNIRNSSKAAGYRLKLIDGSMTTSLFTGTQFSINLNWQNIGITPTYEKWNVVYELRNATNAVVWSGTSSFKPQMFMPQTTATLVQDNFTLPVTIPAGTYQVVMLVTDPGNYRKPLPLAIRGRNADGSYPIRSVTVSQTSTATANKIPTANAGPDQTITLPTQSVTLNGSSSSDADGSIAKYRWRQVGGPGTASFIDNSVVTATAQSLLQGAYSFRLTVTDNSNDSAYDDVTVTVEPAPAPVPEPTPTPTPAPAPEPTPAPAPPPAPAPELSISIGGSTNVACFGSNTGSATVNITSGTAPYIYKWNTNPEQNMPNVTNLTAGSYSVTVWDANEKTATANVTITQPTALLLNIQADSISVNGGSTTVSLSATGGVPPYSFTGPTTVKAGTYTYAVKDANGCTTTKTFSLSEPAAALPPPPPPPPAPAPAALTASISSSTSVNCFGGNNGAATVTASGGTAPYTYSWNTNPVQTTANATQLAAGSYTVIVRDAASLATSATVTITSPSALVLTAVPGTITSYGGTTNVNLSANGGTAPYTYAGQLVQVPAGTYTYTVTDAKGCQASTTITITQPTLIGNRKIKKQSFRNSALSVSDASIKTGNMFRLYPNPAVNSIMVNMENEYTGKGTITIVDMNGRIIKQVPIQKTTDTYMTTVDVSSLMRGYYTVKVRIGPGATLVSKLLKL